MRRITPNARILLALLSILALSVLIPLGLHAAVPGWWEEKRVYQHVESGGVVEASDYTAANQGQLKNVAVAAYEHLLATVPAGLVNSTDTGGIGPIVAPNANVPGDKGSPGFRILALVRQWIVVDCNPADFSGTLRPLRQVLGANGQPSLDGNGQPLYSITGTGPRKLAPAAAGHKDFTAVNIGQIKAVADPFYDRLAQVYAPFGYAKPWGPANGVTDNYALANLGQLKNVFRFDLSGDSDGDGLSDLDELAYNRDHPAPGAGGGGVPLNPFQFDSDGDGLSDGLELVVLSTNPGKKDSDGDGVSDDLDKYPNDARRSVDIPTKTYAVIEMSWAKDAQGDSPLRTDATHNPGILLKMALGDDCRIGLLYANGTTSYQSYAW